ncbi:hypothetical protein QV05_03790 [Gallibacterium genomosp. 1]|uniref:Fimbrial protein n=1 Tax=Gallibacterium genomosp. 1 TaxID=155515 RepID=A0AB36DXF4_9PAST|nr:fimbrial protein [Gallibacterium genomosp. 1]OBX02113.1 hypothetical protein QV05_03790 [Gallibacterium genomosp. 1]
MKKLLLTTLITVGLGLSAQGAFAEAPEVLPANSGGVNFTGSVNDTTCKINGADGGNIQTVKLSPVSALVLQGAGKTAGDREFSIELSDCQATVGPVKTKASLDFKNDSNVDANGFLKNNATTGDAAGEVVLQLLQFDNTPINITTGWDSYTKDKDKFAIQDGKATLRYKVRYYATGNATAGAVQSRVNYTLAYE